MKQPWRGILINILWTVAIIIWLNALNQHPPVATMTENQRLLFGVVSWIGLLVFAKFLGWLIKKIRQC
ncbi:hypothetical protein [Lapidilactobacillus gannanensis]|jgi:hypothetical protein|uniref:DUF3923 family protein n=1 Tax=Lapidilactobacillus gannanensis TaxID=2486002 RepID=A0ABW4BPC0_9LACO|nr:hypothetical protein [Lapidilactobacillus gannanensis]MCH4056413.1 hypothetical protein [Lactobacillaceae bacterium]